MDVVTARPDHHADLAAGRWRRPSRRPSFSRRSLEELKAAGTEYISRGLAARAGAAAADASAAWVSSYGLDGEDLDLVVVRLDGVAPRRRTRTYCGAISRRFSEWCPDLVGERIADVVPCRTVQRLSSTGSRQVAGP